MRQAAATADVVSGESVPEDVRPHFRAIQSCALEDSSYSRLSGSRALFRFRSPKYAPRRPSY